MKKKQVLVLLMAATLTVGTVSPVYAMETESENCEMMTEMVETAEEISSVSETEGTFSEEIAEFATTSELGVVDESIAPDAVAVLSEAVADETLVPTQVKESVIVENTMTLSDTELTVYMKRGIGIYPIFSGEEESVTWTTTDPSVTELIYDPSLPLNIMISGLKPGTATVTCTSASGLTASCHVTVKQLYHAESVSINQQNVAMKSGEVMTLDASVYPVEATPTTELEWYSSDPSIVEVDSQTGEITALQPGTVTITVWTRNKKSGTCTVTVKDKESVDKTALKIAIETAKEALKEEDKYTEESVKVLKAAVAEAKKVAANEKATQESVDAATQAVEEAIEGLKEKPAVPEVNKDALKEAIETAKKALKEEDKYTEESVKVLKAAVREAEKVAANEKATQESVDAATQAVEEAIEGLEEKTVVPEDKDSIVKIQFVDEKGNVVAGGDYFVDKDGDGIFNHTEILEWVPEGYELKSFGDYLVELFKETPLQLTVVKSENPDQKPENPDQKPENPEQKPENPEQKPENPEQQPENPEQKPENPEQKPENPEQKPENPDQKPENPDQKPENPEQKPENPEQKPENPDQKPENPEQQPENPDQKPVSPKTGDPTMVGLYGVATVLSAGIIAKMRKSFKRKK